MKCDVSCSHGTFCLITGFHQVHHTTDGCYVQYVRREYAQPKPPEFVPYYGVRP